MARPAALPTWATNVNYSGGPLIGTPTKIAPAGGRIADGWRPQDLPPGQEENYTQDLQNQWTAYLDEPRRINTTKYPLAQRNLQRVIKGDWTHFASTWSHTDALVTFGALVFDLTTGAGAGTVAHVVLDLPNGSDLTDIAVTAQAGAGHSALPDNHKARYRLHRVDVTSGTVATTAFRTDPAVSTGIYEAVHTFSFDGAFQTAIAVAFGVYPTTIDNTLYRYVLQYQSEEGTGTTVRNGYTVIGMQTSFNTSAMDDGR